MHFWHCLQQEAGEVPYHTVVGALRRIGPATRSPPAPRRGNSNSSKSDIEGNRECRKEGRAREEEQEGEEKKGVARSNPTNCEEVVIVKEREHSQRKLWREAMQPAAG